MKNLKPVFDRVNNLVAFPIGTERTRLKRRWVVIDLKNWRRVKKYKWFVAGGYFAALIDNRRVMLHRFILKITESEIQVDHIDGNIWNCTEYNLRSCTPQQNAWNRSKGKSKRYSSKYKGVYFNKGKNQYQAYIAINNRQVNLGYFVDEMEAAKIYDKYAKRLFGEFAKLNFPEII